jgi:hypothetical protein
MYLCGGDDGDREFFLTPLGAFVASFDRYESVRGFGQSVFSA